MGWPPQDVVSFEGPHFVYEAAPDLFLGRVGRGPLRIVWDTNVLIDYLDHGHEIWEGEMPVGASEDHTAELEGLWFLLNLWMVRDIDLIVLPETVAEAKRKAPEARRLQFERAIDQTAAAFELVRWDEDVPPPHSSLAPDVVSLLPRGDDRGLVTAAHNSGAHVFLTADKGILRCAERVASSGLLLASPLDLLEQLIACGAMQAVFQRETVYWPMPDLQRASHLIQALPPLDD